MRAPGLFIRPAIVLRLLAAALLAIHVLRLWTREQICASVAWNMCQYLVGDTLPLAIVVGCLLLLSIVQPRPRLIGLPPFATIALLCLMTVVIGLSGRTIIFGDFDFSRDEVLAVQDGEIIAGGKLMAQLPSQWEEDRGALQPFFIVRLPDKRLILSAYLPVHSALRALVSKIADPAWLNPLLSAVSVWLLYMIGRRLWPTRPDAALLSAVLLASSPQFLITSMTSYAMSAHLALNLLWLWLFLRDRPLAHLAAMIVGFAACGLHQLIFHPLFVAPFLLSLWQAKRWRLLGAYVLAYGAMGLFWINYWLLLALLTQTQMPQGAPLGAGLLVQRLAEFIDLFEPGFVPLMGQNLVRFVVWQSPLVVGLFWLALRRQRSLHEEAMVGGIVLTILIVFVVTAEQGLGWGYRYLHGCLGSLCLLAGAYAARLPQGRWVGLASALVGFCVLLPLHLRAAADLVTPYREAVAAIEQQKVDVVLVDTDSLRHGVDLVRNRPQVTNHPVVLALAALPMERLAQICAAHSTLYLGRDFGALHGIEPSPGEERERARIRRQWLEQASCGHRKG